MNKENYYLELLNKLIKELTEINLSKEKYAPCVYNCIVAGIIIRMNSIIDQCMIDFHSKKFNGVVDAIYSARQLLVHYSDYRTFNNIEKIADDIIMKFNKSYKNEKEYFNKVLSFDDSRGNNVVIPKSKKVVFDEFTNSYIFMDDFIEISVTKDRVTKIQDFTKKRDLAYIIDCNDSMNYFYRGDDYEIVYQELEGGEVLKDFFKYHFSVIAEDYNGHRECVKEVIDNFYKRGNYSAVYVNVKDNNSKKKDLYCESNKILDKYFNEGIVYRQFLNSRYYSNNGIPENDYPDYKNIKDSCIDDLVKHITKKDYFFINKTISIFDNINLELKRNDNLSESQKEKMKMAMLINWADRTFKKLNEEFVSCNEDFKNLHLKLLSYRTFFAHNILQQKPDLGEKILEEFYDIAKGYVSILSAIHIDNIEEKYNKNIVDFLAIEKSPSHFVNDKHEQYVQVDPNTYMGNKLFYSTKGSEYNNIIGLVPVDKNYSLRGTYYEKKNDKLVAKTFKSKSGKSHNLLVSKLNFSGGKNISLDVNLDDLLFVFAAYKGKIKEIDIDKLDNSNHKKVILFKGSEDNDYKMHATCFEDVIFNYYQQRYIPFELAKETKLGFKYTVDKKLYFVILDMEDNEIGYIIDSNELEKYDIQRDKKGFFTINETIHNFTRRC